MNTVTVSSAADHGYHIGSNQKMRRLTWMKRTYTVSKDEKSGLWYAHKVGFPWIPVFGSFSKSKRAAQRVAADCMALPLKEYLQLK